MTSGANSPGSYLPSKIRSSKIDDNYLKELNEDLMLRKQELLEMLKPLEDKNNLLFQKLMSNLEEKQRSLQIMRQIMAGKGCEESSVMELLKEAEEMKQNLTFEAEELSDQQKAPQIKNKADLQDGKEKQQRKMEWVKYQEQNNILQNDFHGKVIKLRIEALKNYQKANDLKLSLYLQQNSEPIQAFLNLPGSQGTMGTTTMDRVTTGRNEHQVRILGAKIYTEQQGTKGSQPDDAGGRLFFLRSLSDEALKN
ncbi:putative coiled-coil domain-containing protein 196 isoform X5 [Macaca thibetana thibetana]|uniref:putative coiled-coil domain-containing protein 196 isoform X5 n=1 Tax=Macaca thibetana thibetana TaxID=257877 RepID=UPI0021BCB05E|nr:putative coiled-coil domain-containing protein 196 isoform X5 [Macaca thibetana thibetana]